VAFFLSLIGDAKLLLLEVYPKFFARLALKCLPFKLLASFFSSVRGFALLRSITPTF